jgi:hypothetical protein
VTGHRRIAPQPECALLVPYGGVASLFFRSGVCNPETKSYNPVLASRRAARNQKSAKSNPIAVEIPYLLSSAILMDLAV